MTHTDEPDLNLRPEQKALRQINRKKLIMTVQVVMCVLILCIAVSFWPTKHDLIKPEKRSKHHQIQKPEGLEKLPQSYAAHKTSQAQPGSIAVKEQKNKNLPNPKQKKRGVSDKLESKARASKLFFTLKQKAPSLAISHKPTSVSLSDQLTTLSKNIAGNLPALTQAGVSGAQTRHPDPNYQSRKRAFVNTAQVSHQTTSHTLQKAQSPYMVLAGTLISASLLTGLNSDLPGLVIAQVTQNVYDTITGQYVLIPTGSRLIGKYDSVIAHGQTRALVTWSRLILPNGSSLTIDNLPATDTKGFTGLSDEVDRHPFTLLKGIVLATLLNIGSELAFGDTEEDSLVRALREGSQENIEKASDKIIRKQLDVQPTIKVRPGWPLRVIVRKDLILEPYRPHTN